MGQEFESLNTHHKFSGVWRRWERAWFGTMRSQVRSLSPRPINILRLKNKICGYRISVILQPSKLERWVRFPLPAPYGERSSVGRAPVCGTGCRGFESHRSPHLGISPSGKAPHFDCGIRRFESCYPCHIFGLLAQSVEHLTFNQGVRGSIPR